MHFNRCTVKYGQLKEGQPWQLILLGESLKPELQSQAKLPQLLLQRCSQPPLLTEHSSVSVTCTTGTHMLCTSTTYNSAASQPINEGGQSPGAPQVKDPQVLCVNICVTKLRHTHILLLESSESGNRAYSCVTVFILIGEGLGMEPPGPNLPKPQTTEIYNCVLQKDILIMDTLYTLRKHSRVTTLNFSE